MPTTRLRFLSLIEGEEVSGFPTVEGLWGVGQPIGDRQVGENGEEGAPLRGRVVLVRPRGMAVESVGWSVGGGRVVGGEGREEEAAGLLLVSGGGLGAHQERVR